MKGRMVERLKVSRVLYKLFFVEEILKMNRRDQELLDKQLHGLNLTPRSDGVMILAILAVFFTGIAIGGFLYAYTNNPVQIAANDTVLTQPHGASPITR
jgi:hypothetical protein